jgi:hypothetical protein
LRSDIAIALACHLAAVTARHHTVHRSHPLHAKTGSLSSTGSHSRYDR